MWGDPQLARLLVALETEVVRTAARPDGLTATRELLATLRDDRTVLEYEPASVPSKLPPSGTAPESANLESILRRSAGRGVAVFNLAIRNAIRLAGLGKNLTVRNRAPFVAYLDAFVDAALRSTKPE